ncbi:MAG: glycosyltransferase [Rhodospirillaceae bacterium]|nr:glycosyltransferase [Rhodospirillaceae bacterium]
MTGVFFHVQHLLGIGHVRRAALIVRALADAGARVTVAFGGFGDTAAEFAGATVVRLPPARAADSRFSALAGESGTPVDDAWKAARRDALLAAASAGRWDALVTETFPFGRNQLRFELEPLLDWAYGLPVRPRIFASVRDILVAKPDAGRRQRMVATAARWYDAVLVHGDPALVPLTATLPEAAALGDRVRYTGYVAPPDDAPLPPGDDGRGEIVVSVGGGAAGAPLLCAAVEAAQAVPAHPWRILVGPDTPGDAVRRVAAAARPGCVVEPARADFPGLLRRCALSVSQAGYNTMMDVLAAGCRAVVVPFSAGAETEQPLRARLFAERGLAVVLDEAALSPAALAAAVTRALAAPGPAPLQVRRDGAAASARIILGRNGGPPPGGAMFDGSPDGPGSYNARPLPPGDHP